MKNKTINRWIIALAGTTIHLFLGTVYAWSFFQNPISETYDWTQSETAWTFSISIFMLGITASWCGGKINKFGAKKLAFTGVSLYALGYIISYFALKWHILPLLYLGFGIVGGIGLGIAYVTPVTTVASWFPERQGLITGMVVMGFGLGAFIMSKILAPAFLTLFNNNLAFTFLAIGVSLLIFLPPFALLLKPKNTEQKLIINQEQKPILQYIITKDYIFIWLIFTFNIIAGMIFIAFQSPMYRLTLIHENITHPTLLEQKGATLIGISAIFNGIGRLFWGSISDKIGQINAFRILLTLELSIFIILIFTESSFVFFIGVCLILLCYGGGFGIIPSLIKAKYGSLLMGSIYGVTLIGWGVGGILGPQLTAYMKDYFPLNADSYTFYTAILLISIGLILAFLVKEKK